MKPGLYNVGGMPPVGTANRVGTTSSHVAAVGNSHPVPSAAPVLATQQILKPYEQRDQNDRKTIGTVEGLGGIFMMPLMLDMGTALLSKILTIGGIGGEKWASRVNGVLRSPFRALRDVEGRDGRNFINRVDAKRAEFNARSGLKTKNGKLEARVARNAEKLAAAKPEVKLSALGNWFERQMSKLVEFKPLQWLDNKVRKFANWRHDRLLKSASSQLEGLGSAINNVPAEKEIGFFGKALNKVGGKYEAKPYNIDYTDLKPGVEKLNTALSAKDAKAAEAAAHEMIETNRTIMRNTAGAHNHALNLQTVRQNIRHGATALTGAAGWKEIGEEGGSAIAKAIRALPKGMGKASLLHVAFGAGAALMVAAKFMDGGRENRLESHLIKEFAADVYGITPEQVTKDMLIGADAHPLVSQVAHAAMKAKGGRGVHNALHAGFEVANVATLKGMGAGGMLLLPWYGGPGMPGIEEASRHMLIGENSALIAHQELKAADKGLVQMSPEDKINRARVIIASVPGFAKQHGNDNRQVELIATQMVEEGMSAQQIIHAAASPEKIVAMSRAAQAKLDAKAAEAKAPEAQAKVAEIPETMLAAGKPSNAVSMKDAVHEGKMETLQKEQGVHA